MQNLPRSAEKADHETAAKTLYAQYSKTVAKEESSRLMTNTISYRFLREATLIISYRFLFEATGDARSGVVSIFMCKFFYRFLSPLLVQMT